MSNDDEFDIDLVTNYASLTTISDIGEIFGIVIEGFSRVCKFSIFEITSISHSKKKSYGILRTDWKTHFKCEEISSVFAYVKGDTSEHIYVLLNEENLLHLKDLKPKFFETYVAQRYIFPDNQDITERPIKKFEFELGFHLFTLLSDLLVFKHQKNILNYQADFILELKNNFNGDIPSIVVEIDEDEHASYTPENEKLRQSVIEAYNNRMIKISVKRTSTQQDIEDIAIKYSKIIRDLAKELITDYSFEFDEDDFTRILQDNTIEPNFIKMFFDNKTGDPKFRYYMSDVGDFLGYSNKDNYKKLRTFLNGSHFEENVDWKVQKAAGPYRGRLLSTEKTDKNLGGSGHNKKIIIMTRVCFNTLCIVSRKPRTEQVGKFFAKVHDVALDYAQRLRVNAITNIGKLKENKEDAKKRMDVLVEQRVDKTKLTQISKENKELQEKIDSLLEKIVELETTVEDRDKSLQIVRKNISNATYEISLLEEEKKKLEKRIISISEELRIMKESSISDELYQKKDTELKEYKLKYNVLVKKYNANVLKNNSENTSALLARIDELEKMMNISVEPQTESKIKFETKEPKKSIVKSTMKQAVRPIVKTPIKQAEVDTKISSPVKPIFKTIVKKAEVDTKISSPMKPIVKTIVKKADVKTKISSQVKQNDKMTMKQAEIDTKISSPIKTIDVKLTKVELSAKTINALKDICRDKSLSGFSSQKTKSVLIDWMLTKL